MKVNISIDVAAETECRINDSISVSLERIPVSELSRVIKNLPSAIAKGYAAVAPIVLGRESEIKKAEDFIFRHCSE